MLAPEVTEYIKKVGNKMDAVSDEIDLVNQIKYDEASVFDSEKDKKGFRQYDDACDRVKNFYAVS
jgi:inositol oxygenase